MSAVLIGAVMVILALLVGKLVNRRADKRDNGGHHRMGINTA